MSRPARVVLLGHPVAHALSPRFQNAALRAANIPLTYEAVDVAPPALTGMLHALVAMHAAGNVTIPHKEAVFAQCARVTPLARRVGAVNTFWTEQGQLVGHNTDVDGFAAAVAAAFGPPVGWKVAVLGAGGSAAAVLAAIERWPGVRAVVTARSLTRAAALIQRFEGLADLAPDAVTAVRDADLVVNATPLGLHDDTVPIDPALLAPTTRVFDLVYRTHATAWVRAARQRGLAATDGLAMLVEQGALAFECWFGVVPDRAVMHAALSG